MRITFQNSERLFDGGACIRKVFELPCTDHLHHQVANWYGMFLHESQYLEPVMRDIEAMLQESQRNVNGTAILELRPLSFSTVGVESKDDLVKTKFGEYGEMQKGWTAEDAKGFIKVTSTPLRVYYNNHKDEEI